MPKNCSWGLCNSNSKYGPAGQRPREDMNGVRFFAIPKPKSQPERCKVWVAACGRDGFGIANVTKNSYICSKHFVDGQPTEKNPDPLDAHAFSLTEMSQFQKVPHRKQKEAPPKKACRKRNKNTSEMVAKPSTQRKIKHYFKGCSCLAPGCDDQRIKKHFGNGIVYHNFPHNNEKLLEQWLTQSGIDKSDLKKNSKLCNRHFSEKCYTKKKRIDKEGKVYRSLILKSGAVPTRFAPMCQSAQKNDDASTSNSETDITKKYLNASEQEKVEDHVLKQLKSFVSFNTFYEPNTCIESTIEIAGYSLVAKKQGQKPESSEATTQTEISTATDFAVQTEKLGSNSIQTQTQDKFFWKPDLIEQLKKARSTAI